MESIDERIKNGTNDELLQNYFAKSLKLAFCDEIE